MADPELNIAARAEPEAVVEAEDAPESETATAVPAENLNFQEALQEYSEMVAMMPQYIRDVTKKMDVMRSQGIPDRAAYEKLRIDLTQVYDRFRDVSQRMVDFQEGLEDSYSTAMEEDAKYHAAQETEQYGRREADHAPYEERKAPLELYDEEVRKLLTDAIELEELGRFYEQNGTSEQNRPLIRAAMMGILEKLKELDTASDAQQQSLERESLIDILTKLDERYPSEPVQSAATASPVAQIRATHRQVKAQYVAIQHTLSDSQRREIRTRIAQLAGLVQEAEDDAWRQTFAPPPPPEPPAPKQDIAPMVQLAMSRAAAAAPRITDAVLSLPSKRGMFAALGDAFKLK